MKIIEEANRVISPGTQRVTNIVRRLKSFARLDEAELKEVDIHEGIEDTLALVKHELKHKVQVEKDFGLVPNITCFPGQLNQVFMNLIVNGAQAISEKGVIRISTSQDSNNIVIVIEDTGRGIAREEIRQNFRSGFHNQGCRCGNGIRFVDLLPDYSGSSWNDKS